jgi:hypothetical protein
MLRRVELHAMTTRDTETLADLINARAGKRSGAPLSFDDLADLSLDEVDNYRPSGSMLWKIARGQPVKINPSLIRAIAAGLGLDIGRVRAAAYRQYIVGFEAVDPGLGGGGDEDEVIRAARKTGVTPSDGSRVEGFVRQSRSDDLSDEG